jgi:hypothetical protein
MQFGPHQQSGGQLVVVTEEEGKEKAEANDYRI